MYLCRTILSSNDISDTVVEKQGKQKACAYQFTERGDIGSCYFSKQLAVQLASLAHRFFSAEAVSKAQAINRGTQH